MKKISNFLLSLFLLGSTSAIAHEGHGVLTDNPAHYMLSIEHSIPIAIALFAVVVLLVKWQKNRHHA